jgi:3',5'-cyclic AMP phosphodiesterase CpdA
MNVSRRDFLTSAGGLIAVSSLPSFAKDDPAVFPDRGRFERLTLAYQHIDAGATSPFSILHISDTHFTAAYPHEPESKQMSRIRRTRTFGGHQEEALRDSLAWAKDNVDYVLHTGDLIEWQSEANFDMMKKFFGDNTIAAVGNHEFYTYDPGEKHTWQEPFKERSWKLLKDVCPADPRFNTRIINGVNFVCMDDVFGTVQPDQVEKFHAEVKKGLPIILCMHVPFITPFIWRAQKKFWKGGKDSKFRSAEIPKAGGDYKRQQEDSVTREFIAYLKKETLLKGILAGHLHITVQDRFSPTAMQYVVGGNFLFHGQEITFS